MNSTLKPKPLTPKTFEEAKAEFFESKKLIGASRKTIRDYRGWLGIYPFKEITIQSVEKYIRLLLDRDVAYTTRIIYLNTLRYFANWCVRRGYLEKNPVIKPQWKQERPERYPITEEEYHRLLEIAKKVSISGAVYVERQPHPDDTLAWTYAVTVGWHTGLRLGDVCNLRWDQVNTVTRVINLKPRKTLRLARKVAIPYGVEVAAVLEKCRIHFEDTEIVCPPLEQVYRIYPDKASAYFTNVCAQAGVEKSFHCFRHGFITRLLSKNYSAELVAGITGQSLDQVLKYCQISMDTKRQMLGLTQPERAA